MPMTPSQIAKLNTTRAEMDAIYRTDFLAFAYMAFTQLYPTEHLLFELCHQAVAVVLTKASRDPTRQIINAPPRSLKSFLVSIAWPAFMLGHNPAYKIICASYSQDLAIPLSIECRRLMELDWYRGLFRTRLAKSNEDELRTTAGGFRIAKSVGGTLTGLGADALIIDDPLKAGDALSDALRKAANDWFAGTLMSRLNDKAKGVILVVMQRLHQDDLTGYLLDKGGWDQLVLPSVAQRDMLIPIWNGSLLLRSGDELQEREGIAALDPLRRQMGNQAFNAQYLQEPLPDTGNMLDPKWLSWCDCRPVRQPGDEIVQSWDTALTTNAYSDYSVGLTFLVRNKVDYYVLDMFRKKLEFTALCDAVQAQARKHSPNAILIEDHAAGLPLIAECNRRGMSGTIGRRPTKDKRARMAGETPKLEGGHLIIPKSLPDLDDFKTEYVAFPGGKHDDIIDALSQFLNWRTEKESRSIFSFDFGHDDSPFGGGAPSPDELFWQLKGARLNPPLV